MNSQHTKLMQRSLVYGTLLGAIALLAFHAPSTGRLSQPAASASAPSGKDAAGYYTGPMRRISLPTTETPAPAAQDWHKGVALLEKPIQLSVSNTPLSVAVSQIAHATGLNLVCFDAQGQGRITLSVHSIPTWQAMQALADASGGHWERTAQVYTLRIGPASAPQTVASAGPAQRHPSLAIATVD